jgi:glutamate---cysteine ligase / carboxylate-amine ligase
MQPRPTPGLFECFGVELEYMIVDRETLDVRPLCDRVIEAVAGEIVSEVGRGALNWSNELMAHVIELKTAAPAPGLAPLPTLFSADIAEINRILDPLGARLMPTAMHPWMDPFREAKLWEHEYSAVYEAFDRIFDCRGHGWANLQSTHLNLPFSGDDQFGRLHAAIRLILPLLPALAAASPFIEGRATGLLDNRLDAYRSNARRIPSVSGRVIPERVFTHERYQKDLLEKIYADIAPHDPDGILREEWVNARGAIARFDRHTIEIRLLDVQECPQADLAIAGLIVKTLVALVAGRYGEPARLMTWEIDPLESILLRTIRDADEAVIDDPRYLDMFGLPSNPGKTTAGDVWRHLAGALILTGDDADDHLFDPLRIILEQGPLARRILRATGPSPDRRRLSGLYRRLCDCLAGGRLFDGND